MLSSRLIFVVAGVALASSASAGDADGSMQRLETVVVSGEQPGPGLWRVSKGDHEMWILGTLTPLPKRMKWISRDVEATIARSQEVLFGPHAELKVGPLTALTLLPSLVGARDNPNGARLADVVPPALYARWEPLRETHLGKGRAVEKRRPIFAAQELYQGAVERTGLALGGVVLPVVRKAAKKHHVPITEPEVRLEVAAPRAAVKEFKRAPLDDLECFERTMDRVETDIEPMKARANAWASGDIEALRALPYVDQNEACDRAFLSAAVAHDNGLDNLEARLAHAWIEAAEKALAKNAVTFAALPMAQILDDDGLVATLRANGYTVEAPE